MAPANKRRIFQITRLCALRQQVLDYPAASLRDLTMLDEKLRNIRHFERDESQRL